MLWLITMVLTLLPPVTSGETNPSVDSGSPKWTLSPAAEHVDAQTATRLLEIADAASGGLVSFDRRLLAVNWILAYQFEPMATRLLLGISEAEDAARAGVRLTAVADQLKIAKQVWESLRETESLTGDGRWQREERLEGLQAFTDAFSALWQAEEMTTEARSQALQQAALDIAVVLEDERASVAAGAQLWQAYLYAEGGRLSRAIDLLPAALSAPPSKDSFGLYARLLRCRYVAQEHRGYAAATALLARVEERCADWFKSEADQKAARRAAALVRRSVLANWGKSFQEAGKPQRAEWCQAAIARLDEQFFPVGSTNEVLRLQRAVPFLVDETQLKEALREKQRPSASGAEPKSDLSTSGVEPITSSGVETNSDAVE